MVELVEHLSATIKLSDEQIDELRGFIQDNSLLSFDEERTYDGWLVARGIGTRALLGCVGYERRDPDRVYMQSLCIKKGERRAGLGKLLSETLLDEIVQQGEKLYALTAKHNYGFYQKLGFRLIKPAAEIKKQDDVAARRKHKYCMVWMTDK